MQIEDSVLLPDGELMSTGAIDHERGYLYFSKDSPAYDPACSITSNPCTATLWSQPCGYSPGSHIYRLSLNPFQYVDRISMQNLGSVRFIQLDPFTQYAYASEINVPGSFFLTLITGGTPNAASRLHKIDLDSFTIVKTIDVKAACSPSLYGCGGLQLGAIDSVRGFAYYGHYMIPDANPQLVRINLTDFSVSNMIPLPEGKFSSFSLDLSTGYGYSTHGVKSTEGTPRVVKYRLADVTCNYPNCITCSQHTERNMFNGGCFACPIRAPVLCENGICAASQAACLSLKRCADKTPYLCASGLCEATPQQCLQGVTCNASAPLFCWDGTCVVSNTACRAVPACPAAFPIRCSDGSCTSTACGSAAACPASTTRCNDGSCQSQCAVYNGCPTSSAYLCPDGRCVVSSTSCQSSSTASCALGLYVCYDGSCVSNPSSCPVFPLSRKPRKNSFSFDTTRDFYTQVLSITGEVLGSITIRANSVNAGSTFANLQINSVGDSSLLGNTFLGRSLQTSDTVPLVSAAFSFSVPNAAQPFSLPILIEFDVAFNGTLNQICLSYSNAGNWVCESTLTYNPATSYFQGQTTHFTDFSVLYDRSQPAQTDCSGAPCQNGGTCIGISVCACSNGWTGSDCSVCPSNCNLKGNCTSSNNLPTCVCESGWTGATCDRPDCIGTPDCNSNGLCGVSAGVPACSCFAGWTGADCLTPTCSPSCGSNGICVGGPTCFCNSGYEYTAGGCTNINECASGAPPCSGNATCFNKDPVLDGVAYECVCNAGYAGDGSTCILCGLGRQPDPAPAYTCSDINGCLGVTCPSNATCSDAVAPLTGYTCVGGTGPSPTPSCTCGLCGTDGCGGTCPDLCLSAYPSGNAFCNGTQCTCVPSCAGNCGADGCFGSCGSCSSGESCVNGQCTTPTSNSTCPSNCYAALSHGACLNGACLCTSGWTGQDCGVEFCGCVQGTCSNAICTCDPGWSGTKCDVAIIGDCSTLGNCSESGNCLYDANSTNSFCDCFPGYEGSSCAEAVAITQSSSSAGIPYLVWVGVGVGAFLIAAVVLTVMLVRREKHKKALRAKLTSAARSATSSTYVPSYVPGSMSPGVNAVPLDSFDRQ